MVFSLGSLGQGPGFGAGGGLPDRRRVLAAPPSRRLARPAPKAADVRLTKIGDLEKTTPPGAAG